MRKFYIVLRNFLKYLRKGGVTYLNVSEIACGNILKNKKVLITGGSNGIGLAIAKKCLSEGATVLITGRDKEKLNKVSLELNTMKLTYMVWDISDITSLEKNFSKAVELLGGLDIVVNNAAFLKNCTFQSVSEAFWDKTMDTNLKSIYFLSRKACLFFIERNGLNGGKILNISSMNSFQGGLNPYFISKRGLNCITEWLAKEFSNMNIKVNGIAPGICDSSINKCNYEENAFYSGNLIHRIIIPSEIAEIALFLLSDVSNSIVGQTIVCDGGQTLR